MAKSTKECDSPQPGPLRVRDSVRSSLFVLRHFFQVTLKDLAPPRQIPAPELELSLVVDVEQALRCSLPDEILACLANGEDVLVEFGFVLGQIADHTRLARKRGCPQDLVAVGCHPDSLAFFCVSRTGPRDCAVRIADFDNLDRSVNWYDLGDWLSRKVEGRQAFLSDQYPALAAWTPHPAELALFAPTVVES